MAKAKVKLGEGMQFIGMGKSGHAVVMDTDPDVGGTDSAAKPMELILIALGGCTGMDVVSILRKMKVEFDDFEIELEAEQAPDYPKVYTKIQLNYRIWGKVPEDKLKKAIELSSEKYCSVANMLKHVAQIDYKYKINPAN